MRLSDINVVAKVFVRLLPLATAFFVRSPCLAKRTKLI